VPRPPARKTGPTGRPAKPAVPTTGAEFARRPPPVPPGKDASPVRAVVGEGNLFLREMAGSWRRNRDSGSGQSRAPLLHPFLDLLFRALVGRLVILFVGPEIILGHE